MRHRICKWFTESADYVLRTLAVDVYRFFGLPMSITIGGFLTILYRAKYPVVIIIGFILTNYIAYSNDEIDFWPITWSETGRQTAKPVFVGTAFLSMMFLISERWLIASSGPDDRRPYWNNILTRLSFYTGAVCFVLLTIINETDPVSKQRHQILSVGCAIGFTVYASVLIAQDADAGRVGFLSAICVRSIFAPVMIGLFAAEKYVMYSNKYRTVAYLPNYLPIAAADAPLPRELAAICQWSQLFLMVGVIAYQHARSSYLPRLGWSGPIAPSNYCIVPSGIVPGNSYFDGADDDDWSCIQFKSGPIGPAPATTTGPTVSKFVSLLHAVRHLTETMAGPVRR